MLKYSFSWLAHHAESYSAFLANSIFQFQSNFFNLNFRPKNFDLKNWFFDVLKYSFSWLAHNAESYSAFLADWIFQFQRNFLNLNIWTKNFDLKNWIFDGLKYSFSWSADNAESYSAFLANSIFQFQRNFFTSISDQKISILKIEFLMASNIVFRHLRITPSHILHF